MVEGFLKGVWGKPAQPATGLLGVWGTVKAAPGKVLSQLMNPFKFIKYIVIIGIGLLVYSRYRK